MTNPQEPNPFGPNPFGGSVPTQGQYPPPPPATSRDETNVLATLSLVFAFVFAPVGAVLGHVGLSQIRRTGQRGRDRALVGVTLSYVFIAVVVVGLAAGLTLSDKAPTRSATPGMTSPRTTTTLTTTTPPPPPTVAPAELDGLLPSLEDVKNFTGDPNLKAEDPVHQLNPLRPQDGSYDRPECAATIAIGIPDAYTVTPSGVFMSGFFDLQNPSSPRGSVQSVAAIQDVATAQKQLGDLQSTWRRCGGSTVKLTYADNGHVVPFSIGVPADSGGGVTTIDVHAQGQPVRFVLAMAAKNNVFIEVRASATAADRAHQAALDVVNYTLGKIPG